jgi:hypothetical protein
MLGMAWERITSAMDSLICHPVAVTNRSHAFEKALRMTACRLPNPEE